MARDKGSRVAITPLQEKKRKGSCTDKWQSNQAVVCRHWHVKAIRPLCADIGMSTMDKICRISLLQEALADAADHIRVSRSQQNRAACPLCYDKQNFTVPIYTKKEAQTCDEQRAHVAIPAKQNHYLSPPPAITMFRRCHQWSSFLSDGQQPTKSYLRRARTQ
jgi:hypothetical protein